MNFITYINQFGSFKTALINYDPGSSTIETQNRIDEDYLVTSVFVEGVKRSVDIDNVVQLAVINDNNFDGSLLQLNHYNVSSTYFSAKLLPLVSGGSVASSGTPASVLYRFSKPTFSPYGVGEFNKDSRYIVYTDFNINNTGAWHYPVQRSYFDTVLDTSVRADLPLQSFLPNYGGRVHDLSVNFSLSSLNTIPPPNITARVYYNVKTNEFNVKYTVGGLFDPSNCKSFSYADYKPQASVNHYVQDLTDVNRFIFVVIG